MVAKCCEMRPFFVILAQMIDRASLLHILPGCLVTSRYITSLFKTSESIAFFQKRADTLIMREKCTNLHPANAADLGDFCFRLATQTAEHKNISNTQTNFPLVLRCKDDIRAARGVNTESAVAQLQAIKKRGVARA